MERRRDGETETPGESLERDFENPNADSDRERSAESRLEREMRFSPNVENPRILKTIGSPSPNGKAQ